VVVLLEDLRHPRRVVALSAVHNFRDLGGYPTHDGGRTTWGRLYRADGLQRLEREDLRTVTRLGIRTVVDLRTEREVEHHGAFPVDEHPVDWHHVSIVDATWGEMQTPAYDDVADFLVWAYRLMLEESAARFARAFTLLADAGTHPAVYHCAAGKDRTGILTALVLSTVGVPDEWVAADYGLTEEAMARKIAWARVHLPELAERFDDAPRAFVAADPRAMSVILADLRRDHGGAEGYLRTHGVDDAAFAAMRAALVSRPSSPR
jgi:protein-tyrosine phosphatase